MKRLHAEDRRAVRAAGQSLEAIARAAELSARAIDLGGRLIYVGAGTSGRLGVLDAAECPPTFGTKPWQIVGVIAGGARALRRPIEGAEDDPHAGEAAIVRLKVAARDVVCGIAASGRTPFVMGALQAARKRGASTVLVCCSIPDPAAAELIVCMPVGPELVAGSTRLKAGTATKLALNAISTAAMTRLGRVYRGRMVALSLTNQKLRRRAQLSVQALTGVSEERSAELLAEAKGHVALAVAMALTGQGPKRARALLRRHGLRGLERLGYAARL